jgi:hypothetical protein
MPDEYRRGAWIDTASGCAVRWMRRRRNLWTGGATPTKHRCCSLDSSLPRAWSRCALKYTGPARGFKPGQLLFYGDRVFIVDFDGFRLADPALDIGYLRAYLRPGGLWQQHPGMRRWFEAAAASFIQACRQAPLRIRRGRIVHERDQRAFAPLRSCALKHAKSPRGALTDGVAPCRACFVKFLPASGRGRNTISGEKTRDARGLDPFRLKSVEAAPCEERPPQIQ